MARATSPLADDWVTSLATATNDAASGGRIHADHVAVGQFLIIATRNVIGRQQFISLGHSRVRGDNRRGCPPFPTVKNPISSVRAQKRLRAPLVVLESEVVMAKSALKRQLAEEQDIRRRIDALTGAVKPSAAMVRASIQPLIDKLARQDALRRENDRIFVEHTNNLARVAPGEPIRLTREEVDAMQAYKAAVVKFAEKLVTKPPVIPPGMPLLKSGSIWSFYNPPYTDRWTDGTGASASQVSGTWSTQSRGTAHSYAGVCTFFTPQRGRFAVRFAPYMPHNYNYLLHVHNPPVKKFRVSKAASGGFLGTYVSVWTGRAWNEVRDVRSTLWNRSLSSGDYFESDDTAWGAPQVEFMTFDAPMLFALWGWGGIWTSETRGTGVESASASLSTTIPYMVIEQKI